MSGFAHLGGDPTPLTSSAAVVALWEWWGSPQAVVSALEAVPTWGELVALPVSDRVRLAGPVLGPVELPLVCPPIREVPGGARPVTPYDVEYPQGVPAVRWPVLYLSAPLPAGRRVLIAGADNPSPQAVEIARSAALAAAADRIPVVAAPVGAGLMALRTAAEAGASTVTVLSCGSDQLSTHQGLLDELHRAGGTVVTAVRPGVGTNPAQVSESAHLAVALSSATVICEVGAPPSIAATLTQAAIASGQILIAPPPPPHYVPAGAAGLRVLTDASMFTPEWYGTSARIAGRVSVKLPPVDYVVTTQRDLGDAIRAACLPKESSPQQ